MEVSIHLLLLTLLQGSLAKVCNVEEVIVKNFDNVVEIEQYLCVLWHARNCKTCDRVLGTIEKHCDILDDSGVKAIKVIDKKLAKQNGILLFPSITLFKGKIPTNFKGNLNDEDEILEFLIGQDSLISETDIESISKDKLNTYIEAYKYVLVIFYDPQDEESEKLIEGLKPLDDKAKKLGVFIVKIFDLELLNEYQLKKTPGILYYRHSTPIVYEGDLSDPNKVLKWAIKNKAIPDSETEDLIIEDVPLDSLDALISSLDSVIVLFYESNSRKSDVLLSSMDDLNEVFEPQGIDIVKVDTNILTDSSALEKFGISRLPSIIFFIDGTPDIFNGHVLDAEEVSSWINTKLESQKVEEIEQPVLREIIKTVKQFGVIFCKYIGYGVISLFHTCYLLRMYQPNSVKRIAQNGVIKEA